MSGKKNDKLKVMTESAEPKEVAKEMATSIRKMYEDRDEKAVAARKRLIDQLVITIDKYRTANGVMSALETVRMVCGTPTDMTLEEEISLAKVVASNMSTVTNRMVERAELLEPDEMDKLCDGMYDKEFSQNDGSMVDMVQELMVLQLCQNVGPSAEDITEFLLHADQEIDKARENLEEYCKGNGVNFNELCGPHDKCPDCLCMSCAEDCKEGRTIKEGQSAYEVCESFCPIEE